MKGLRIFVRADEPLILTNRKNGGTGRADQEYIVGNKFLGSLANVWTYRHRETGAFTSPEFRRLFLEGGVSFGNATPEINGRQSLVMPLCLTGQEEQGHLVVRNLLCAAGEKGKGCSGTDETDTGLPGYLDETGRTVSSVHVIQVHHINLQRSVSTPRLFSNEAVDSGTRYVSEFYVEDGCLSAVRELLDGAGNVVIGSSRTGGYGRLSITRIEEFSVPEKIHVSSGQHTFLLTSGFFPMKSWQGPLEGFLELLGKHLGPVTPVDDQTYVELMRTDGFNAAWNSPRCTRVGLVPGSVITVRVGKGGDLPVTLGTSLQEGYGRFVIDLPLLGETGFSLEYGKEQDEDVTAAGEVGEVPPHILAIWRRRSLQRQAREQAVDCVWNSTVFTDFLSSVNPASPTGSQRSRVQQIVLDTPQSSWAPLFSVMISKQAGRQWKVARARSPFSPEHRRVTMDEIMLGLLDMDETEAMIGRSTPLFRTLPEPAGAPMTAEESSAFRLERHRCLLVELFRRWDRTSRTEGGEK